jgi:lipoprotein-releasing system ATP-binding protein
MSVLIQARDVHKSYRDGRRQVEVLRGIDLSAAAGELLAVVGPSGSGKSTLLHILGALEPTDSGTVTIGDQDLAGLSREALAAFRNRTVGFVFQFHRLLPDFDALENVMMPGRIAGRPAAEVAKDAQRLLEEVGLEDRLDHFPNQLSGGERQRVALCRALLLDPPLLLADEPTGNLDPQSADQVLALLLDLQRRRGTTTVLVTHNPRLAERCGRILCLEGGVLQPGSKTHSGPLGAPADVHPGDGSQDAGSR